MVKELNKTKISYFVVKICLFVFFSFYISLHIINAQADTPQNADIPFNHVIIDSNGPQGIWQKSVGDLNGDGRIDLIAGGYTSGGLVWYESPNWTKHEVASEGRFSTDAEVADIDKDGDNDIISLTTSEIRWYENPNWTVHTIDSRTLHDVEVADFDGDGDIDIVARNQSAFGGQGNELHFYRQDSPTSWTHRVVNIANGEGLHVVDIDGDGDKDVVIGDSWFENTRDIVNGPWTEHVYTTSWAHVHVFVATGDINGDGRLDIVLSPAELAGQTYHVSWFEAPVDPKSGNWTEHIIENNVEADHHFVGVADMDNDGDMDIAAAEMQQGSDPDEVKIYINGGNGQSWTKQVIASTGSHSMRIVDIDNDGDMDLYGTNWQDQKVEMWENLSKQQTLDKWQRHVVDSDKPWRSIFITSADMDGDGKKDIITGGWWYKNPGTPDGSWTRNTIGSPLNNMAIVYDFDKDGDMDVLGTEGQGSNANANFVWARNDGSGNFTILNNISSADGDFLQGVAVGQFQKNGSLEVALSWHTAGKGIQVLSVPANPSSDTWSWRKISDISQDEALSAGDIDRDGDLDLLLGTKWLCNNGSSWILYTLYNTDDNPDRNRLADINRDGRLDAVVGFEAISKEGKLAWYEQGSQATSPWTEHVIAMVIGPMSLDVADMDGDGDLDVVVGEHNLTYPSSAKLHVFENVDGKGTLWTDHIVYTGDEHHDGAQLVDIDGDGDLDIISIGWGHNRVVLYENKANVASGKNANGLQAFYTFDEGSGTIAHDSSGNGNNGTINGATWTTGKNGGGLSFDGVDDYVEVPDSLSLNITDKITLSAWVYYVGNNKDQIIISKPYLSNSNTYPYASYSLYIRSDDIPGLWMTIGGVAKNVSSSVALSSGQWHHLVGTYDGSIMKIYVNGKLTGSYSTTGTITAYATPLRLGTNGGFSEIMNGKLDECRIYNRAMSDQEVQDLYSGLQALYTFDEGSGTIVHDSSSNGNDGTINGATWTTGKNGGGLSFDGVDDYMEVPDSLSLNITDKITLSAWVYYIENNKNQIIISKPYLSNSNTYPYASYSLYIGSTGIPGLWMTIGDVGKNISSSVALSNGQWYHLVGTYDGSIMKIYVNGKLTSSYSTTGAIATYTAPFRLGTNGGLNEIMNGKLDECRIYNRALSDQEVQDLYSGLQALYTFDEGSGTIVHDSSSNGNDGTINGATWTTGKNGDGLRFDGINDYVSVPPMNDDEISISAWFYKNANNTTNTIFEGRRYNVDQQLQEGFGLRFYKDTPDILDFILVTKDKSGKRITKNARKDLGNSVSNWYHVAGTYNKTTGEQRLYVNGQLVNTQKHPAGNTIVPLTYFPDMRIGHSKVTNGYFNGIIDNVLLYNRALSDREVQDLYNGK